MVGSLPSKAAGGASPDPEECLPIDRKLRCEAWRYTHSFVCSVCLITAGIVAWNLWTQRPDMLSTSPTPASALASSSPSPSPAEVCATYLGVLPPSSSSTPSPPPRLLRHGLSLLLTADPGDFSGTPEAHHVLANLVDPVMKPRGESVCAGVVYGSLMGQDVAVVTTGIGPTAAGLCTQELLAACGPSATELIYFGTSGWSPQLGGVLNPPDCAAANANRRITRVGDVCVSPVSVNWVCKKSTWELQAEGFPNQCFRPGEAAGPNATELYGECLFATDNLDANLALSDALIGAARSARGRAALPARAAAVAELEGRYWGLMGQGTGLDYPDIRAEDPPRVWDYRQCAEVDGQFFFTGAPWEIKARDYAAQAIATGLGYGKPGSAARDALNATEVIAVSAMEGVGVAEALEKYHRLSTTPRRIPYTNVRTLSNWIHQPVGKAGGGRWEIFQEVPEDYVHGYAYAIATGSVALLTLYQQRCRAAEAMGRMAAGDDTQRALLLRGGEGWNSGEGVGLGAEGGGGGRGLQSLWRRRHVLEQQQLQRRAAQAAPGLRLGGLEMWLREGAAAEAEAGAGGSAAAANAGPGSGSGWGAGSGGTLGGSPSASASSSSSRCHFKVRYP